VELHVPGAPPIVAAALEAALRHGARPAAPGEFTLRAFLAGRLDLTQAEAVLGVVDAVDRRRLDTALKQMAGGLTTPLRQLRSDLLDLTAHLEAGLDFVEEDIEFIARDELMRQLNEARESVAAVVAQATARGEGVERPRIALHGLPNVGKSSLFNALAQHDRALVSPTAGTTRDYLTAVVSLNGVECELIDTAGVEPITATQPSIDSAAQEQAMTQSGEADLLLICLDGSRPPTDWERQRAAEVDGRSIVVRTKADVTKSDEVADGSLRVSVVTGEGLDELRTALADAVRATRLNADEMVPATAVRCRDSLHRAAAALSAAAHVAQSRGGDELVAVELRTALDELGRVVGAVYTDDILDRIFSRFCIGK
jgi:tRNA modification GTPase